jgi:hypothetical protein
MKDIIGKCVEDESRFVIIEPYEFYKIKIHPLIDRFILNTDGLMELTRHLLNKRFPEVTKCRPICLVKINNDIVLIRNFFYYYEAKRLNQPIYARIFEMTEEQARQHAIEEIFIDFLFLMASQSIKAKTRGPKERVTQTSYTVLMATIITELFEGKANHLKNIVPDNTKLNHTQLGIILGRPHSTIIRWTVKLGIHKPIKRRQFIHRDEAINHINKKGPKVKDTTSLHLKFKK